MTEDISSRAFREILERTSVFAGLSDLDYRYLHDLLRPNMITYKWGEIVLGPNANPKLVALIAKGQLQGNKYDEDARLHINQVFNEYDFAGLIELITGREHEFDYTSSHKKTVVLLLDFTNLINNQNMHYGLYHKVFDNALHYVFERYYWDCKRLEVLSYYGTRTRILKYFEIFHQGQISRKFFRNMNQHQLAHFLCVTRPLLSVELNNLYRERGSL